MHSSNRKIHVLKFSWSGIKISSREVIIAVLTSSNVASHIGQMQEPLSWNYLFCLIYILDDGEYKITDLAKLKLFIEDSFIYVIGFYIKQPFYRGSLHIIDFNDLNNPYVSSTYEIEGYPQDMVTRQR